MQFVENNNTLSFSDFSHKFPTEAAFLREHQGQDWKFVVDGERISFAHAHFNPIFIDIRSIMDLHKRYFFKNSLYKEPLARALGLKKGKSKPKLLDATAGFLGDSLLMLNFDIASIKCLERHPVSAVLAYNAISNSDFRLEFEHKSAIDETDSFDVCYFDPMYSEKNLKTSPKKEMAVFRDVIGCDDDSLQVAHHLHSIATQRLVIKRSIKAPFLLENPHHSIKGKSTRYDVYLKT